MSIMNHTCCLLLAAGVLAQAQPPQFAAPLSGLVYDAPSAGIRPLMGVPGAAWLGKPVLTGLDFASVAPNGRYALAVRAGQAVLAVFEPTGAIIETQIAGALPDPGRAAWALDGSAVLLASSAGPLVQRIAGLPDSPYAGEPIEVPGEVTALAIDAPSGVIVAGLRAGPDSGLYLLSEAAPPVRILSIDQPAAAVFSRNGRVLYAADRSTGGVFALRNLSAGAEILPATQDALAEPAGLAVSDAYLYVAGAAGRLVCVYDLASGARVKEIPLDAVPAGVEPVSDRGVFLISGRSASGQPLLLLDARAQSVYYVPAGGEE